jgi:hypothetical protein
LNADPADTGAIRLSNADYIWAEADPTGTDISVIGVDADDKIQIGASGTVWVGVTPPLYSSGGIFPTVNKGSPLGSLVKAWADLFIGGEDSTINYNDGDIILTFSTNTLNFAGASSGYIFDGDLTISGGNINTGDIALVIGDATTDTITFTADGSGNAEFTFPADVIGEADIDWGSGAGQIDLADIPGGISGANVWDLGGATSLEIPNGGPTVDTLGEIGIDTTSDQFAYMGAAKRILTYQNEICVALEDPVDADDNIAFYFPRVAIAITDVYCQVDGGTSVALTISDGTNALEAITCDDDGAEDDGSIANGTFTALERMEFDLASTSGVNTLLNFCITYTITAD